MTAKRKYYAKAAESHVEQFVVDKDLALFERLWKNSSKILPKNTIVFPVHRIKKLSDNLLIRGNRSVLKRPVVLVKSCQQIYEWSGPRLGPDRWWYCQFQRSITEVSEFMDMREFTGFLVHERNLGPFKS